MANTAQINHKMLTWARERSGIPFADFASKCGVSEDRLSEWETGKKDLTFNKAQLFAQKAHVPFGYLFLINPPEDELPIPDLRTVDNRGVNRPSSELLDLIKLTLQRQLWYREYLSNELEGPCSIVGSMSIQDSVKDIVDSMRHVLGVLPHPVRGDNDDYYRDLVTRIESIGVLVMRESFLGHHTRMFKVEEFRGFAISDEYAPVIFVNHADAPGPRLFTLIHELCHIWLGISGVSDASENTHDDTEIICNAVAAEFLVPESEFSPLWKDRENWKENLPVLENHFRVSKWVIARRALTLNFISTNEYRLFITEQIQLWKNRDKNEGGGGSYYRNKNAQISKNFSKAVLSQAFNGHILIREAGQLLGVKSSNIRKFASEVGF